MRIAIFGTGAIGGYFGGRLAQAGLDVTFIARGKHLQAIKKDGLRVESICGDFSVHPVAATDEPTDVGEVDAILLGVKAWQVQEAAQVMQPMLGLDTFVVTLQNGVDAPTIISNELGPERIVGGLCKLICLITKPGHIRHAGADRAEHPLPSRLPRLDLGIVEPRRHLLEILQLVHCALPSPSPW